MTLKEALEAGFTVSFRPSDLRLGLTIRLRRPRRDWPSFEEGLLAWNENRSTPLHDYITITLESASDIEMLMEHSLKLES